MKNDADGDSKEEHEYPPWAAYAYDGCSFTASQAAQLEDLLRINPNDWQARHELIGYYMIAGCKNPEISQIRLEHILWFIDNFPESSLVGTPFLNVCSIHNLAGYEAAKGKWLSTIKSYQGREPMIGRVASFFAEDDLAHSIQLLRKCRELQPENVEWSLKLARMLGATNSGGDADLLEAIQILSKSIPDVQRTNLPQELINLSKLFYQAGLLIEAEKEAENALRINPADVDALHEANTILGLIALKSGDVVTAKAHLATSAKAKASAALESYGLSLDLANELLKIGQKDAVNTYLKEIGKVFQDNQFVIDAWRRQIKTGKNVDLLQVARESKLYPRYYSPRAKHS